LLRGIRLGGGGGDDGASREAGQASAANASGSPPRPFCNVFIRGDRYELDGVPSDIATAVAARRATRVRACSTI
jgi:hypothetical protein